MFSSLRQLFKDPNTRPFFIKSLAFLLLFGVTFYGAYGMAKSFYSVNKQKNSKEKELKSINQRLNAINTEANGEDSFQKEKVLREKLHMVKPGEDLIIVLPAEETKNTTKK